MARIRSVHPELCRDETLVDASDFAERTFVRLWPHLDDDGRALDNPRLMKADLYPLHDSVTAADVDAALDELNHLGLVIRYVVDGTAYVSAKPDSWGRWQKPRHPQPSKFPGPEQGEPVASTFGRNGSADGGSPTADRDTGTAPGVTARRRDVHAGGEWSGVGVGEGGVAPERTPQCHDLIPKKSEPSLFDEIETIVAVLTTQHGDQRVSEAVQQLVDDRRRFPFPSAARKALEAILGPVSSEPARPPVEEPIGYKVSRLQAQLNMVDDERDRDAIQEQIDALIAAHGPLETRCGVTAADDAGTVYP